MARRKKNSLYSHFLKTCVTVIARQKRYWKKTIKKVTNKARIPLVVRRRIKVEPTIRQWLLWRNQLKKMLVFTQPTTKQVARKTTRTINQWQKTSRKRIKRLRAFGHYQLRIITKRVKKQSKKILPLSIIYLNLIRSSIARYSHRLHRYQASLKTAKSHLSAQLSEVRSLFSAGLASDLSVFLPSEEVHTVQIQKRIKTGVIFAQPLLTSSKYTLAFYYQKIKRLTRRHLIPYFKAHQKKFTKWSKSSHRTLRKVTLPVIRTTQRVARSYAFHLALSLVVTLTIAGSAYGIYFFVFENLPSPQDLIEKKQILTTRILDRKGETLYRIYEDENRTLVPLAEIPQHVIDATIAIEDQDFYDHWGFSIRGITRALIANSKGESIQGGSTITQQLVKNRLLTNEKTIRRKVRELLLSVLVERTFTKEQILEMYLNQVAYGGSTYGIEEAAQRYFGKSVRDLTVAEGAMLAGLPQAPSIYSPFGSYPELAYMRQEEVLRRMVEEGMLTQLEAETAKSEILAYRSDAVDIKAPHFVMYVRQLLAELYGEDVVNQGGLEVTTTLDLALQNETQKIVTDEINNLERLRINNGAALVTNPTTGEVLAMVGSKDYFDFQHDGQVNVTLRPRQPGSSIKPLTYAMAMERGKTPNSIIEDTPITFTTAGSPPYSPRNYDGRFHGRVTLRQALASSYNIPAVKLLNEVGINNFIDKGEQMGITTWGERNRFGLSLTLGGGEVLMTDMAKLYGTFANYGYTVDLNPILEIKDSQGTILYQNKCALYKTECRQERTLDPRVAFQLSEILSDNVARAPAFGTNSVLNIPGQQVAVKTGTTNNLKDNWTIGYTSERLVAVWVGNNDGTPMSYVASGVTGASPIWNNIMGLLLDENNPHAFARPDGFIKVAVCAATGTLPCNGCPAVKEEYFLPGTEPKQACNAEYFKPKTVSQNSQSAQPVADPQPAQLRRRDER